MTMSHWELKLDEFLLFNEKEILKGKGNISSQDMMKIVDAELKKYKQNKVMGP
ncbi:MAG: RhuM family protein [Candidatus Competibacteraceae bacterium]